MEAERRGLANHPTTADALPCFVDQKSIDLFGEFNVLSEVEVRSRYEVKLEKYNKLLNIEARTMKRMVRRFFLPAINSFAADVARDIAQVKAALPSADQTFQEKKLQTVVDGTKRVEEALDALNTAHLANVVPLTSRSVQTTTRTMSFHLWTSSALQSTRWRLSSTTITGRCRPTTRFCSTAKTQGHSRMEEPRDISGFFFSLALISL